MFEFYRVGRPCPECGGQMVTATPLNRTHTRGLLSDLGIACWCVTCNCRFRAVGRLPFLWVGWLGAFGRRLWWQTVSFKKTLEPPL